MSKSHLVRMPDLSALEIPAKQCLIRLKDGTIFSQLLQQHRELADREGGACLGDYVLIRAAGKNGEGRDLHIQLGENSSRTLSGPFWAGPPEKRSGRRSAGRIRRLLWRRSGRWWICP